MTYGRPGNVADDSPGWVFFQAFEASEELFATSPHRRSRQPGLHCPRIYGQKNAFAAILDRRHPRLVERERRSLYVQGQLTVDVSDR